MKGPFLDKAQSIPDSLSCHLLSLRVCITRKLVLGADPGTTVWVADIQGSIFFFRLNFILMADK